MASGEKKNKKEKKSGEVNEPGGVYQPQGPLNFEKVWQMFQETDKKFQETDRKMQETDRKMQETDRRMQETDRRMQETDRMLREQQREAIRRSKARNREFEETNRVLREVSRITGGLGNNVGEAAEEYFRGALGNMPEVAGLRIRKVDSLSRRAGGLRGQFDIVVFGDQANVLVEVKHRMQLNDVIRFQERTLPVFRQLYPEHCRKKVFGAVAGMSVDDAALAQALELGFLVFTQSGQELQVLNPAGFEPREL